MNFYGVNRINNIIKEFIENDSSTFENIAYINYGLTILSKKGISILLFERKKRIIVHWIGSDTYSLQKNTIKNVLKKSLLKFYTKVFKLEHWVASNNLKEELNTFGVKSKIVYIPTNLVKETNISEFPQQKNEFLTYLPKGREHFYGSKLIMQLARSNPDITIHIVANNGIPEEKFPNIVYHGYVDESTMNELYTKCKGVIRVPKHDALGGTILEGVLRGRYGIWIYDSPYTFKANSYFELENAVNKICELKEANYEGANYILENYNYSKLSSLFLKQLKE